MATMPQGSPPSSRLELARVTAPSWFEEHDAPDRRGLHTCIHCGLCLTACPTYRETKIEPESPRGRIYLMRALAEGRIDPDESVTEHLDNCLACRACETVCPAGVPYAQLIESTRGQMTARAERRSFLARLGGWVLGNVFPDRERLHLAGDLLRLGQLGPMAAILKIPGLRDRLPRFVSQGWEMLPPLEPRSRRRLDSVQHSLPPGARLEETPEVLIFHPAGAVRARAAFFTACVTEVMFPRVNQAIVQLLVLAGCQVAVPVAQTCCGALHSHAGHRRRARELARRNVLAFGAKGLDVAPYDFLVTGSAGCGAALRDYGHLLEDESCAHEATTLALRVRDFSEVLDQLGLPEAKRSLAGDGRSLRVAMHDPCHLAHAQKVRSGPRRLLRGLPGVESVELANSDWCCGSAGIYNLTHPEQAERQLRHKVDTIAASQADVVVASNPGCQLYIRRGVRERGLPVRVSHLAEVLAEAYL